MKTKIFLAISGAALLLAAGTGCVGTVSNQNTMGVPLVRDRFEGRYERTVDQVSLAAREVVIANGALTHEGTVYGQSNAVRVVEGKINQRNVWIRIEPVDAKVTSVLVQARTRMGGADIDLVHEIEKQIALRLTVAR